jgi:hypothetical protein
MAVGVAAGIVNVAHHRRGNRANWRTEDVRLVTASGHAMQLVIAVADGLRERAVARATVNNPLKCLGASTAAQDFEDAGHQHGRSWWTTRDVGIHRKNRIDRAGNLGIRCECAACCLDGCSLG